LSVYAPTEVHFPALEQSTPVRFPSRLSPALEGAVTSVARPQTPADSVAAIAGRGPELSVYEPTAVQFPALQQLTLLRNPNGSAAALEGEVTSVARAHLPPVSVAAITGPWPELSVYWPTAVQVPALVQSTPTRFAPEFAPVLAGATTSVARAQVPFDSVAAIAWSWPELSSYAPTAVQFPALQQLIPSSTPFGSVSALEGALTSAARAQTPRDSVAASACW
jgi:hypothetical protein